MSLFQNPKGTVIAVSIFVVVLVLFLATPKCHASENAPLDAPYVQFSAGSTILRGIAPVIDLGFTEKSSQLRNAYFQEDITLVGSSTFSETGQSAPNNAILRRTVR